MNREERRNHREFLNKCNEQLPELAAYVFSLRNVSYNGCGFHYSLEKRLGKIIAMCNDYERLLDVGMQIIEEVIWESFLEDIATIKEELKNK